MAHPSAIGDFSKSFMYSIHQMYFLVQKHLDKELQRAKAITFSQFLVLVCFQECLGRNDTSQSGIARHLHTTEATISRHMATLEKLKLVQKKTDPLNRRKSVISITPRGAAAFSKAHRIICKELESLFSIIRVRDRKSIIENFDGVLRGLLEKSEH